MDWYTIGLYGAVAACFAVAFGILVTAITRT